MSKKKKKYKKSVSKNYSTIEQHRIDGKSLVPPLLQFPKLQTHSWRDERLAEMLWASLLVSNLPRPEAISVFRQIANYISKLPNRSNLADVTHTGLANAPEEDMEGFLKILVSRGEQKRVLSSLLLFENLPARDRWLKALIIENGQPDISFLMNAVAKTLDHQSQEATDCRWMRILAMMVGDRLKLPSEEIEKEIAYYPNYGDMREIRPSIRAVEGLFSSATDKKTEWPEKFWDECWRKSPCFPLNTSRDQHSFLVSTNDTQLKTVHIELIKHFFNTNRTTATDVQHDTVFGTALYCLSILKELIRIGNAQSIISRLALRTLLECFVTISYLFKQSNPELWKSYRVFGCGQAKLSFLKIDEDPKRPSSIDLETLRALANEDVWQEFLPINLGHWEKTNLRKLSEVAQVKDDYDRFYPWTSAYTQGHWGPIRETVFTICGNPLHRLHRIPLEMTKSLPDVISDACILTDKVLDVVSKCYPDFPHRVTIQDGKQ
jgi:hypothetical protein